jgi:membrane protein YdbS with pleckstrin-like domain
MSAPAGAPEGPLRIPVGVDRWMVWLLAFAAPAVLVSGVAPAFDPSASPADLWISLSATTLVVALVAAFAVPLRYEMTLDELRVRAGLLRYRLRFADLVRLQPFDSPLSSATAPWTMRRVRLVDTRGRRIDVGPKDRVGFLAEVLARAPQLVERGEGDRTVWIDPSRA